MSSRLKLMACLASRKILLTTITIPMAVLGNGIVVVVQKLIPLRLCTSRFLCTMRFFYDLSRIDEMTPNPYFRDMFHYLTTISDNSVPYSRAYLYQNLTPFGILFFSPKVIIVRIQNSSAIKSHLLPPSHPTLYNTSAILCVKY